jgi:hypothetical protein
LTPDQPAEANVGGANGTSGAEKVAEAGADGAGLNVNRVAGVLAAEPGGNGHKAKKTRNRKPRT